MFKKFEPCHQSIYMTTHYGHKFKSPLTTESVKFTSAKTNTVHPQKPSFWDPRNRVLRGMREHMGCLQNVGSRKRSKFAFCLGPAF